MAFSHWLIIAMIAVIRPPPHEAGLPKGMNLKEILKHMTTPSPHHPGIIMPTRHSHGRQGHARHSPLWMRLHPGCRGQHMLTCILPITRATNLTVAEVLGHLDVALNPFGSKHNLEAMCSKLDSVDLSSVHKCLLRVISSCEGDDPWVDLANKANLTLISTFQQEFCPSDNGCADLMARADKIQNCSYFIRDPEEAAKDPASKALFCSHLEEVTKCQTPHAQGCPGLEHYVTKYDEEVLVDYWTDLCSGTTELLTTTIPVKITSQEDGIAIDVYTTTVSTIVIETTTAPSTFILHNVTIEAHGNVVNETLPHPDVVLSKGDRICGLYDGYYILLVFAVLSHALRC